VYQEKDHFHYSKDEIKEMFKENLASKNWPINLSEYDQLCRLISYLNTELVNLLRDEIHIVIYSEQKEIDWNDKVLFACYLNLRDEAFLKARKGAIFLSPEFLNLEYGIGKLKKLFHEIAHHKLDHRLVETEAEIGEKEEAADKLACEWLCEEGHHLEDC
jgi:hypothetical protein